MPTPALRPLSESEFQTLQCIATYGHANHAGAENMLYPQATAAAVGELLARKLVGTKDDGLVITDKGDGYLEAGFVREQVVLPIGVAPVGFEPLPQPLTFDPQSVFVKTTIKEGEPIKIAETNPGPESVVMTGSIYATLPVAEVINPRREARTADAVVIPAEVVLTAQEQRWVDRFERSGVRALEGEARVVDELPAQHVHAKRDRDREEDRAAARSPFDDENNNLFDKGDKLADQVEAVSRVVSAFAPKTGADGAAAAAAIRAGVAQGRVVAEKVQELADAAKSTAQALEKAGVPVGKVAKQVWQTSPLPGMGERK